MTIAILGGGIAGLSCSYHLGHDRCVVFEKNSYLGGHAATHQRDHCFWDEGPHVSFTKHQEVRDLLCLSAQGEILDYPVDVGNWYKGHWIPHPAQSNLHAVPRPLADQCLQDFLNSRCQDTQEDNDDPANYLDWLEKAYGPTFARVFPSVYTRKYWTCPPEQLTVDWVGQRMYKPDVETVKQGYYAPLGSGTHYITSVRYPQHGGFACFLDGISRGCNARLNCVVTSIDLEKRRLYLATGEGISFERLINTLPLDHFVALVSNVPQEVREAAKKLRCSSLLLVNITAASPQKQPFHWLYVYDEDMYSTRITQTHLLSPQNTPPGHVGIQVEVYESAYRPFTESHQAIATKVVNEVRSMGLIEGENTCHTQYVPYANVIFDHSRRQLLEIIFTWLSQYGLARESDDLDPMTDWSSATLPSTPQVLVMAGRFAQWKYFWTDDCILRGKRIAASLGNSNSGVSR